MLISINYFMCSKKNFLNDIKKQASFIFNGIAIGIHIIVFAFAHECGIHHLSQRLLLTARNIAYKINCNSARKWHRIYGSLI